MTPCRAIPTPSVRSVSFGGGVQSTALLVLGVAAMWAAVTAALVGIDLLARTDQVPAAALWQIVLAVGAITIAGHTIHTTRETPQ